MQARLVTITVQPDKMDEATRLYQESVVPAAMQQPGNRFLALLTDAATGKGVSISIWDDEQAMLASEQSGYLQEQLQKFGSILTGPPARESFSVLLWERAPSMPEVARLTWVNIRPDAIDDMAAFYKESIVPELRMQDGFLGALVFGDRETGKGCSATVWASRASMEAGEASGFYSATVARFTEFFVSQPTREVYDLAVRALPGS